MVIIFRNDPPFDFIRVQFPIVVFVTELMELVALTRHPVRLAIFVFLFIIFVIFIIIITIPPNVG